MSLRIIYRASKGEFAAAMKEKYKPVATAAKAAIVDMAGAIKAQGRADIAAAGFGVRWQNTFRADTYPKGAKVSANAAAFVFHKIPYADVFETGATIRGKPMLWLPLANAPKSIGRKKITPQLFIARIGPLFRIERPGKPPLLAARISKSRRKQKGVSKAKVTLPALRRGASGAGASGSVPLFVGVDSVSLRDRFSLREITDRNAGRLTELYFKNFRDF